jgi:hypothetical protein
MSSNWYSAGIADTKMPPRPPAAVADVWTIAFSLGPKFPPRIGKFSPSDLLKNFRIAKPKIAPKRLAANWKGRDC